MTEQLVTDAAGSTAALTPTASDSPDHAIYDVRLSGCRSRPLVHHLKALGLFRIISRQVDPSARARWSKDALVLRCNLDQSELTSFLLEHYVPTPVVSPWNGGSGFFPTKYKRAAIGALESIRASTDGRLVAFRHAIDTAHAALAELKITEKPTGALKIRLVRHLRAQLDDEALEWLDAAIVLLGPGRAFPPLLGSGGNDGNYDVANNYAQAIITATALTADGGARERARCLLANALYQEPAALQKMSVGHFMRDSSPVNSPTGESDGLGNPWDLVLAVEGCCLLAAGATRRHGVGATGALVAPFTARMTAAGYGSAVAGEKGRSELWLPLWSHWTSLPELTTLTREGRAQVGRRQARSGLDFVRAARELGVARGIDRFERFVLLERAGQATLAVPAGTITVAEHPHAHALRTLDRWLSRVQAYGHSDCPRAHARAIARLETRLFTFADRVTTDTACAVLEALGELESLLAMSRVGANSGGVLSPLTGAELEPWLLAADDGSHEFAVAVALATLHDRSSSTLPTIREYLHGTARDEHNQPTYRSGAVHTIARRADPIARLAQLHTRRHLDALRVRHDDIRPHVKGAVLHESSDQQSTGPQDERLTRLESATRQRQLAFPYGVICPLASARAFAASTVDDQRIMRLVSGLALLQPYLSKRDGQPPWRPRVKDDSAKPVPVFERRVAGGVAASGPHRSAREPLDSYGSCRPVLSGLCTVPPVDEQLGFP